MHFVTSDLDITSEPDLFRLDPSPARFPRCHFVTLKCRGIRSSRGQNGRFGPGGGLGQVGQSVQRGGLIVQPYVGVDSKRQYGRRMAGDVWTILTGALLLASAVM